MKHRTLHLTVDEKTEVLCRRIGEQNRDSAYEIARATEVLTFLQLDQLVQGMRRIAKGNG